MIVKRVILFAFLVVAWVAFAPLAVIYGGACEVLEDKRQGLPR